MQKRPKWKDIQPNKWDTLFLKADMNGNLYISTVLYIYDGPINPNHNELSEGRFWKKDEICTNIGNNLFTPNFEDEYQHFFGNK